VIGLSHILLDSDIKKEHKDYVDKIQLSGNHILHLINDILDYSKLEAGKFTVENIPFNINTLLENISTMVSFKAFEKGLNILFDVANDIPALLKGDALRLSQVIINLMNNAVKFTHEGDITLSIKVLKHKKETAILEFCVADTGIGLSPDKLESLFQSYVQADESTAREFGGTGLGLSISKQLVELMGGAIRVESVEGEGSSFIFTIETTLLEDDSYAIVDKKILNKRVLIVDPSPKIQDILARMLQRYAYDTVIVQNKAEFEKEIALERFDIVFMDKGILPSYKSDYIEDTCEAQVIIMHSNLEICVKEKFQNVPISSRLVKPFHPQFLHDALLDVFDVAVEKDSSRDKHKSKKDLQVLSDTHILLVEDNKINQSIILALLQDTGIQISVANHGQEAIELCKAHDDIALILMDIEMPIMGGYEALSILHEEKIIAPSVPVIALSGNARQVDVNATKEAGMIRHLSKPIDVDKLYATLLEFITPKHSFVERSREVSQEILALIGLGKYVEVMTFAALLRKDNHAQTHEAIIQHVDAIDDNILKYKNIFLVMVKNYNTRFKIFVDTATRYLDNASLSKEEEQVLSLKIAISVFEDEADYRRNLENFIAKYRDSVAALSRRAEALELEEAIQLSYQIKREAEDLQATYLAQALAPIVAIEKTQRKTLDKLAVALQKVALEEEESEEEKEVLDSK